MSWKSTLKHTTNAERMPCQLAVLYQMQIQRDIVVG